MADSRRHADAGLVWFAIASGVAAIAAAAAAATMLLTARTILTPPVRRPEPVQVLGCDERAATITLSARPESVLPGEFSFWFDAGAGHARLGEITDSTGQTVTRRVLRVDSGLLEQAVRGRFSGWFYPTPEDLGVPFDRVDISTELGLAPAWLIRPPVVTGRWVIQVHGRAGSRHEALRAVPVFRHEGYTSLLISYRNDVDAPATPDGRYALGATEWHDLDAAIDFALANGATDIVLMGWSMGGAIALQAATRSASAASIRGLILESPVIDWVEALTFQGTIRGMPALLSRGILSVMGSHWPHTLTRRGEAINLKRMDFVRRAAELDLPILLMHSTGDAFVPITASQALARARPDIVTFEQFEGAGHTKLWNHDKDRFNTVIELWLAGLVLGRPA